ncbi:hypothetical protein JXA85_05565, partial [Candidatus Woesearchaeota archaeon]|nr:hypothetical protein [Candidatus Woesearchaeota archaeon]
MKKIKAANKLIKMRILKIVRNKYFIFNAVLLLNYALWFLFGKYIPKSSPGFNLGTIINVFELGMLIPVTILGSILEFIIVDGASIVPFLVSFVLVILFLNLLLFLVTHEKKLIKILFIIITTSLSMVLFGA